MLVSLLLIPVTGVILISSTGFNQVSAPILDDGSLTRPQGNYYKILAFIVSIINLIMSLIIYIVFDFSNNQFQFVAEHYNLSFFDIYLGLDGVSIYFVLLTTIIIPVALLSN